MKNFSKILLTVFIVCSTMLCACKGAEFPYEESSSLGVDSSIEENSGTSDMENSSGGSGENNGDSQGETSADGENNGDSQGGTSEESGSGLNSEVPPATNPNIEFPEVEF